MRQTIWLLILMVLTIPGFLFGQSISLNYIEFHGEGGTTDQVFEQDETVSVRVLYDASSLTGVTGVYRSSGISNTGQINILWYDEDPPADVDGTYEGIAFTSVSISNFALGGDTNGTDLYCTFDFTMPTPNGSALSFRLAFGVYGTDDFRANYGTGLYHSYGSNAESSYSAPPGDTADGSGTLTPSWITYGQIDSTTDAIEEADFVSPASGSRDNSSLAIEFNLDETPQANSVQLWLDTDATHTDTDGVADSNVGKVLTLAGDGASQLFTLDATNLTTSNSNIDAVSNGTGTPIGNSLSDGTTYYIALRYKDSAGNDGAVSAWRQFTYDNSITAPTSVSATDLTGSDIDIDYTLPEDAELYSGGPNRQVTIVIDNTSGVEVATVLFQGADLGDSGAQTITLDGSDFSSSTGYVSGTGASNLSESTDYRISVSYYDEAGNGPAESSYDTITYTSDSSTTPVVTLDADEEAGATAPQMDIDYTLPEAATNGSILLYFDADADTTNYNYRVRIDGNNTEAPHNFNLTYPFTASDDSGDGDDVVDVNTDLGAFTHGNTYRMYVWYRDQNGNPGAMSTNYASFTWDGETNAFEANDFVDPVDGSYQMTNIDINYTLDEAGASGTVKILLDDDDDASADKELTLAAANEGIGNHSFTLNGANISGDSDVASVNDVTADINNALVNGNTYWMAIQYQDTFLNTAATSAWHEFTYDTSITDPSSVSASDLDSASDGDVRVGYTLSEDAGSWRVDIGFDTDTNSGNGLYATVTLEDQTNVGASGAHTVDMDGTDFTASDYYYSRTGAANLVADASYYAAIRYSDNAGNQSNWVYTGQFTFDNDTGTGEPTFTSATEVYSTNDDAPALRIQFSLPEAADPSNVDILIDDASHGSEGSEDASNTLWILNLNGQAASGSHDFQLTVPMTTSDDADGTDDVNSITTNEASNALSNGTTYYFAVRYRDTQLNAYNTSSWGTLVWDAATTTTSTGIATPAADSYIMADDLDLGYQLGEAGLNQSGSVLILVDADNDQVADATWTLTGSIGGGNYYDSGSRTINDIDTESVTSHANISLGSNLTYPDGQPQDYWYAVQYRDQYGNPAATSTWRRLYMDNAAVTPTFNQPVNSATLTGNFNVQYALPENASAVTLTFTSTSGTDSGNSYIFSVDSDNSNWVTGTRTISSIDPTNISSHGDLTQNGGDGNSLVNNSVYTMSVQYDDLAGNASSADSNTSITYSTGTVVTTLDVHSGTVEAGPLDGQSSTDQVVFGFNLSRNTQGTVNLTQIVFSQTGSAVSADFAGSSFDLYRDDNNNGSYDSGTDTSIATGVSISGGTVTFGSLSHALTTAGEDFLVICDISGSASVDNDVQFQLTTANITVSTGNVNGTTLNGESRYIDGYITQLNLVTGGMTPTTIYPGDTNTPVLRMFAAANQGSTTITSIAVDFGGDVADADIGTLYIRTNTSDDFSTSTQQSTQGTYGSTVTFSGLSINLDTNGLYFYISLDVESTATGARTLQADIDWNTTDIASGYNLIDPNLSGATTGNTHTIGSNTLTVASVSEGNDPLGGPSSTNQLIFAFSATAGSGQTVDVTGFSLDLTGTSTAGSGDFASTSFEIRQESGATAGFQAGEDAIVTGWSAISFANPLNFSGTAVSIDDSGETFYVICDLSASADEENLIGLTLADGTDVTTSNGSDQISGTPVTGNDHYLDGCYQAQGGDYGTDLIPGVADQPFFRFQLSTNQGSTTFTAVTIALSGTAVAADFDAAGFQLFADSDDNFSGASAIGSGVTWDGTNPLNFSGLGQNIDATGTWYFLTADVASSATNTNTIQATVTLNDTNPTTGYGNKCDSASGSISGGSHTLPVELSEFNIHNQGRTVMLQWTTQSENENAGFNIYRGLSNQSLEEETSIQVNKAGLIPGAINSVEPVHYVFEDEYRIDYGVTYYYWLETIDLSGISEVLGPMAFTPIQDINPDDVPNIHMYGLHPNYPNPFNPETKIEFYLQNDAEVILDIYNIRGERIRKVFHGNCTAERLYSFVWDGTDRNGKNVSSGIYFYRLRYGSKVETRQMILLK